MFCRCQAIHASTAAKPMNTGTKLASSVLSFANTSPISLSSPFPAGEPAAPDNLSSAAAEHAQGEQRLPAAGRGVQKELKVER